MARRRRSGRLQGSKAARPNGGEKSRWTTPNRSSGPRASASLSAVRCTVPRWGADAVQAARQTVSGAAYGGGGRKRERVGAGSRRWRCPAGGLTLDQIDAATPSDSCWAYELPVSTLFARPCVRRRAERGVDEAASVKVEGEGEKQLTADGAAGKTPARAEIASSSARAGPDIPRTDCCTHRTHGGLATLLLRARSSAEEQDGRFPGGDPRACVWAPRVHRTASRRSDSRAARGLPLQKSPKYDSGAKVRGV